MWKRELTSLSGPTALSSSTRLPPSLLFQVETQNEIRKSIITERKLILMVSMTPLRCFLDIYSCNRIQFQQHISLSGHCDGNHTHQAFPCFPGTLHKNVQSKICPRKKTKLKIVNLVNHQISVGYGVVGILKVIHN